LCKTEIWSGNCWIDGKRRGRDVEATITKTRGRRAKPSTGQEGREAQRRGKAKEKKDEDDRRPRDERKLCVVCGKLAEPILIHKPDVDLKICSLCGAAISILYKDF
jgi:hypothetical protein